MRGKVLGENLSQNKLKKFPSIWDTIKEKNIEKLQKHSTFRNQAFKFEQQIKTEISQREKIFENKAQFRRSCNKNVAKQH